MDRLLSDGVGASVFRDKRPLPGRGPVPETPYPRYGHQHDRCIEQFSTCLEVADQLDAFTSGIMKSVKNQIRRLGLEQDLRASAPFDAREYIGVRFGKNRAEATQGKVCSHLRSERVFETL